MKQLLFSSLLIVVLGNLFAQETPKIEFNQFTPSGEYLSKGLEYYKNKDYKNAILEFSKIHENDTNYALSLADRAATLIQLEEYEEAEKISRIGLENNTKNRHLLYRNLASALNKQKKHIESIEVLDQGLKEFPFNLHMQYAKILYLDDAEKDKEAAQLLMHQLKEHQAFPNFHLKAGLLAYNENQISKTMMAYGFYLIYNVGNEGSGQMLYHLNEIVRKKTGDTKPQGFKFTETGDDFSDIDLLINNYAALSDKYKIPLKIDLAVIKQFHLLISKLEYDKNDKGFFMQYYVPIYKKILSEDKFKGFSFYLLASSQNEQHQALVTKNMAEVTAFRTWFDKELKAALGKHTIEHNGTSIEVEYLYSFNGILEVIGNKDAQNTRKGYHQFLHDNGAKSAEGVYDSQGQKHGVWKYYNENSILFQEANYEKGKLQGAFTEYHSNSNKAYDLTYKDGKADGIVTYYNILGNKYRTSVFVANNLNGATELLHENGALSQKINYKDGLLDGSYENFYAHGQLKEKGQFKAGKRVGYFESYYADGQVDIKSTYNSEGQLEGNYESYFYNGQLYEKGNYAKGIQVGEWNFYHKNGNIHRKFIFDETGRLNGQIKEYDVDGKIYEIKEIKKGELVAYHFYDKNKKPYIETEKKSKQLVYKEYSPDGVVLSSGVYENDQRTGEWKFYHPNGILKASNTYKEDQKIGVQYNYYDSGLIESAYNYDRYGKANSNFVYYYENGNMKKEGYYLDNYYAGEVVEYYANGQVAQKDFYIDGDRVGKNYDYAINGKLNETETFDTDFLVAYDQYDTNGVLLNSVKLPHGTASFQFKFPNGKISKEQHYINGKAHGTFTWYYPTGQVAVKGDFFNGSRHGKWLWYHLNGKIQTEGNYFYGNKKGDWKDFYDTGIVEEEYYYENDDLENERKYYYPNGKLLRIDNYYRNDRHGKTTFFDISGEIEHFRYYSKGNITAYSYLDKNGEELAPINVLGQTALIESYYKNGQVSRKYYIKNGLFEGEYVKYYPDGVLKYKALYKHDRSDGESLEYFKNGKTALKENYELDRKNGTQYYYYENGNIKETKEFIAGIRHGWTIKYTESGDIKQKIKYYDGSIVEVINL